MTPIAWILVLGIPAVGAVMTAIYLVLRNNNQKTVEAIIRDGKWDV